MGVMKVMGKMERCYQKALRDKESVISVPRKLKEEYREHLLVASPLRCSLSVFWKEATLSYNGYDIITEDNGVENAQRT